MSARRILAPLAALALAVAVFAGGAPAAFAHGVFVANWGAGSVTPFDTQTEVPGAAIGVGVRPRAIAIIPDGRTAYVVNSESASVTPIDVATGTAGSPITVGTFPHGIAITPNGRFAYVTSVGTRSVDVIDTAANAVVGAPIEVGIEPEDVAVTPDGSRAYVTNFGSDSISVIATATNAASPPIAAGSSEPQAIAITPDGSHAYVTHNGSGVTVIDLMTNAVVGSPISVGSFPDGIAISPDGRTAYVANGSSASVTPIDIATDTAGAEIKVKKEPRPIAISPDGSRAYVGNWGANNVSVIDTATKQVVGSTIKVGTNPEAIAIVPDQPPRAAFSASAAAPGSPTSFDAGASIDPDSTIASYLWDFGDGLTASGGPTISHTFAAAGTYRVTLTLSDAEGCSTAQVFTGHTVSCNGSGLATVTHEVVVAPPAVSLGPPPPAPPSQSNPRVRLSCPKGAEPGGCKFTVQVFSAKPHQAKRKGKRGRAKVPVAESTVAKVKLAPGRSALVTLKPKPKFAAKLAAAAKLLVRETETVKGQTETAYRRLEVVR